MWGTKKLLGGSWLKDMQARSVFVDANVFLEIRWKEKGWQSSFEVVEGVRRGEIKVNTYKNIIQYQLSN